MCKKPLQIFLIMSLLFPALMRTQSLGLSKGKLEFEVATIKSADPAQLRNGVATMGGLPIRGRCHGIDSKFPPDDIGNSIPLGRCRMAIGQLDNIVALAYNTVVQMIDVAPGGPGWARNSSGAAAFSIEAKASDPAKTTQQELLVMLQSLLADRFKLKLHKETREIDGYALLVSKNGPKFESANDEENEKVEKVASGPMSRMHLEMNCRRISMSRLALILTVGTPLGRVVDRTNLQGEFDFNLMSDEESGPSIFSAVQDQLGLRLERQKVPIEYLVIDSAEKPLIN